MFALKICLIVFVCPSDMTVVCQLWDVRRKGYVFRYTVRAFFEFVYNDSYDNNISVNIKNIFSYYLNS